MNENYDLQQQDGNEDSINFRELFFKYLINWPWFAASVVACIIIAWLYLHTTAPTYEVNATVLIKEEQKNRNSASDMFSNLQDLGIINSTNNFDNEIEIIKSRSIIKKVVEDNAMYISYFEKHRLRSTEIYKETPVLVYMTPEEASKMPTAASIIMNIDDNGGVNIKVEVDDNKYEKNLNKLPNILTTPYGTFSFTKNTKSDNLSTEKEIRAIVSNPDAVAGGYAGAISIEPTSKMTTIAAITLKCANREKGVDFINDLVKQYNIFTNDNKNEVATKTAEFINERIGIINQELGTTEQKLESFKKSAGLTDVKSDAQSALVQNSEYEKKRVQNATQIRIVEFLEEYAKSPANKWEVLPVNVGLTDNSLFTLIGSYNQMLLERNRLLHSSSESNPAVVNLNASIQSMRNNVLTTIASVYKGLLITKRDLDLEAGRFQNKINNAPGQEREFVSISRQQEIKAGLYLMLLQKREENAITLASVANNAHIIDTAEASPFPVSPKGKMIYLIALALGIAIPVGILYLLDLFKYKIDTHEDVEKITSATIVGDIPRAENKNGENHIVVKENCNDMMAETFRTLRTNLMYMLEKDEKVIMFTSSSQGEGKSFVAANVAVSFALMGKKVVIVGLDIRKPGLNKTFNFKTKQDGITSYLSNPDNTDINSLIIKSEQSDNLDILPGGTIPPNPSELLSRESLDSAMKWLKERYDYVILDTAPIGIVTDTQIISYIADVSVYVCRANYTTKNEFTFINYLIDQKKMNKICTLINDIDLKDKKYGYHYGYGKYGSYGRKYGYKYKYGYSYGYGKGYGEEKK